MLGAIGIAVVWSLGSGTKMKRTILGLTMCKAQDAVLDIEKPWKKYVP